MAGQLGLCSWRDGKLVCWVLIRHRLAVRFCSLTIHRKCSQCAFCLFVCVFVCMFFWLFVIAFLMFPLWAIACNKLRKHQHGILPLCGWKCIHLFFGGRGGGGGGGSLLFFFLFFFFFFFFFFFLLLLLLLLCCYSIQLRLFCCWTIVVKFRWKQPSKGEGKIVGKGRHLIVHKLFF